MVEFQAVIKYKTNDNICLMLATFNKNGMWYCMESGNELSENKILKWWPLATKHKQHKYKKDNHVIVLDKVSDVIMGEDETFYKLQDHKQLVSEGEIYGVDGEVCFDDLFEEVNQFCQLKFDLIDKKEFTCPICEGSGTDGNDRESPPNKYVCSVCNGNKTISIKN